MRVVAGNNLRILDIVDEPANGRLSKREIKKEKHTVRQSWSS